MLKEVTIGLMLDYISCSKFRHQASFALNYSHPLTRACCVHVGIPFIFAALGFCW